MEIYSCFQALDPQTFVTVIVSSRRVRGPCYGLRHIVWQSLAGATDSPSSWLRSHEGLRAQSLQNTVNLYLCHIHIIYKLFYNLLIYTCRYAYVSVYVDQYNACLCLYTDIYNSLHIYGDLQLSPGSGPSDLRDIDSQLEAGPRALPYYVVPLKIMHSVHFRLQSTCRAHSQRFHFYDWRAKFKLLPLWRQRKK